MRILIVGAGNAGCQLARSLCEERHSVVMVDTNIGALKQAEAGLDILTVCGSGSSPRTLAEAEIEKSHLVIAVTDCDEVNILACLYARAAAVPHSVARVSDPDLMHNHDAYDLTAMGISLVINQKQECAREILNLLQIPGAREVFRLFEGQLMVAGFSVGPASPIFGRTPADCDRPDLMQRVRMLAIRRNDGLVVPHGDTAFAQDDFVYLVGGPEEVASFFRWVCPEMQPFERTIIAGGGDTGLMLAGMLEAHMPCVLLEKDDSRARRCSSELNRTLVLRGDALSGSTLDEAGLTKNSAFVALTGDDENNIMNCLMAQKKGAGFTVTQITRPDYMPVITQLNLVDRVANPYLVMTRGILHYLRSQSIPAASLLHNLPGELLDVPIEAGSDAAGQHIRDIKLPRASIIAAVLRDGAVHTATGDLQFVSGDRALVFAHPDAVRKIERMFLK